MRASRDFTFEKETKGTLRFQEEVIGGSPLIGVLYVRKPALQGERPTRLTITLETAKDA